MDPRKSRLIALALIVGSIVVAAVLLRARPEPPRAPPPLRTPLVGTAEVEAVVGPLQVRGSGTVRPKAEIDLAPQVGGRIAYVSPSLVSGGRVRAGEVLLRIEAADYENAVQQARAQVAQDSVGVLEAEEEARIAEAEYEQFKRRQEARGVGSTRGVEAAVEASRLTLRGPQLEAARAALARSEAQLADAELALSRTVLTSPFDGVVRSESVDAGAFAAPGQALARIYATDEVELVVPLSDADASLLPGLWALRDPDTGGNGLPARVLARYGQGRFSWEGYVDRAEAALDEQSRTIDVVVRVPDPFQGGSPMDSAAVVVAEAPPLLVGQFADVEIQGMEGAYLLIPRRAVRPGNEVWVVEDGRIRIVLVQVIQRSESDAFVKGALDPGDRVVTDGIDLATNGMEVRDRMEVGS